MALKFDVRDEKKIRVIVDTDAACEADDPFAIAHALMSPKLMVKGITAAHFAEQGYVEKSLEEIADEMGMTRERIRQVREKAIRKIKHSPAAKMLKQYL